MSFRLDMSAEPGRTLVSIQGRLAGAAVGELERVCRDSSGALVLDMTYLMSVDEAGIATLKRLMSAGVQCTAISPYLALLLGRE